MQIVKSYIEKSQAVIHVDLDDTGRLKIVSYILGSLPGQELRGDPLQVYEMEQPIAEIAKQCGVSNDEARQAVLAYLREQP